MNNLRACLWLLCLFIVSVFTASCTDPVEDTASYYFKAVEGEEDKLPATLVCSTKGKAFDIAFDCGQEWQASVMDSEADNWLHFNVQEGTKGVNRIVLTADPYTGEEDRTASVMILAKTLGKKIAITQTGTKTESARAKRSVLIYIAAENSLGNFVGQDIQEIIQGGNFLPERSKLLVFVDDNKLPRIYEITQNSHSEMDTVRVESNATNLDSAKGETLEKALNFMKDKYPADGYGLTIWSHGEGWEPAATRWIGVDNNKNSFTTDVGTNMNISELATSIQKTVGKLDFLFFDACFMQTIEVAYELRDAAKYIIGSPCEIPGPGAPYQTVVPVMFDEDLSRGGIANEYYTYYKNAGSQGGRYGAVLSTVDCTQLPNFASQTAAYMSNYFRKGTELNSEGWTQYGFSKSQAGFSRASTYMDLKQAMLLTLNEKDYQTWKSAFDKLVVTYSATDFWYTEFRGQNIPLDVEKTGGIAWSVPNLFVESENTLDAFQKTAWYSAVWKDTGF